MVPTQSRAWLQVPDPIRNVEIVREGRERDEELSSEEDEQRVKSDVTRDLRERMIRSGTQTNKTSVSPASKKSPACAPVTLCCPDQS